MIVLSPLSNSTVQQYRQHYEGYSDTLVVYEHPDSRAPVANNLPILRVRLCQYRVEDCHVWMYSPEHPLEDHCSNYIVRGAVMSVVHIKSGEVETWQRKFMRKFKEEPFVPIGASYSRRSIFRLLEPTFVLRNCSHMLCALHGVQKARKEGRVKVAEPLVPCSNYLPGCYHCCDCSGQLRHEEQAG